MTEINKQQIAAQITQQWVVCPAGTGLVHARAGGKSSRRDLTGRQPTR